MRVRPTRVVAVGGHESDDGRALHGLFGPETVPAAGGRELFRCVRRLRGRAESVCVVPMTLGRDAELVADAARTLRALSTEERSRTVLAGPFGTAGHLVGWLRAAAARVPDEAALLVTAPSGDPFDDADLYRIARLVRQYGRHRDVEVALVGGDPGPAEAVRRCRTLGAQRVFLLPAAFTAVPAQNLPGAESAGPLLTPSAAGAVLDARVREAWERRDAYGDDGIAAGLTAAHDHGLGHSHGHGGEEHGHEHAGGRTHSHGAARAQQDGDAAHFSHTDDHQVARHGPDTLVSPLSRRTP